MLVETAKLKSALLKVGNICVKLEEDQEGFFVKVPVAFGSIKCRLSEAINVQQGSVTIESDVPGVLADIRIYCLATNQVLTAANVVVSGNRHL